MNYRDFASQYIGTREGTARHAYIINFYNDNIRPLPRGYHVKLTDSWCATFVSFVLYKCGAINPPYECSAEGMRQLAIKKGQYHRTNPKPDDIIFYCWNSSGVCQHVGIVSSVDVNGNQLQAIEGNHNDKVGSRLISKTSGSILGYATVPHKNSKATVKPKDIDYTQIAKDVIKGKYGNGDERKKKLKKLGYDYTKVQNEVNKIVLGKKSK